MLASLFQNSFKAPTIPSFQPFSLLHKSKRKFHECRASWQELAGVVIFSAIPFTTVKAIANSPLGEQLQERMQQTKMAAIRKALERQTALQRAREQSIWYGKDRPRWLGIIPYDYPDYLTGETPGDYGFDIAGLSKDQKDFEKYFNDAPPVDVVADPDEELHEAFREEWLDMEQEIDELADDGEEEENAVDEEEEEEHQHLDPFPPVEIDHGVGSHQVYERQVYRDIESEPDDDEPLVQYRRQRQRPRKSVGGIASSSGLPPCSTSTITPMRPHSQSPTTPITGARGGGSSGGRLISKRARAPDRTYG